jgi:hypothetical protein
MKCTAPAIPSREAIARSFADCCNPDISARVLEEANDDVGCKPVPLRIVSDRPRASEPFETADAVVPEHATARADPPVSLAVD